MLMMALQDAFCISLQTGAHREVCDYVCMYGYTVQGGMQCRMAENMFNRFCLGRGLTRA